MINVNGVLAQLELGDHVCCPVTGDQERWAASAVSTACGLRNSQKILFFVDNPDGLKRFLVAEVPGAERAMASRQLRVLPGGPSYLSGSGFDGRQMIDLLATEIQLADTQGFFGLRVSGDLSAIAGEPENTEAVIEYEMRVGALYAEARATGICYYDQRAFAPATWRRVVSAHPSTVFPDAEGALVRLRATRTDTGIRLVGEADLTNRGSLPGMLEGLVEMPGQCQIDASGLQFADVWAVGCLLRTALARGGRGTSITCSPHLAAILGLSGAASVPGLAVTVAGRP